MVQKSVNRINMTGNRRMHLRWHIVALFDVNFPIPFIFVSVPFVHIIPILTVDSQRWQL